TMAASKWNEGEVVLRLLLPPDEQLPATIEPGRRGLDEPSPRPGAARARPAPRGASLRRGAGPRGAAAAPPAGHRRPRAPRSPAGRAITEAELGLLGPGKGAVPCSRSPHARWQPAQRDTARRWLRGERR